jgi:hypothetical protein
MTLPAFSMGEEYWETFRLEEEDIEFLYNHLLELETPLTSYELIEALIDDRTNRKKREIEQQRTSGGEVYQPKKSFATHQELIFPSQNWKHGEVVGTRPGYNPMFGEFQVIQVSFDNGDQHEYASNLPDHILNQPPKIVDDYSILDKQTVMRSYADKLIESIEKELEERPDFVRIAGRWFPRALLIHINVGHLNLAEAALDMAGGGPLPTSELLKQIELSADVNPRLIEFSLDMALEEDPRFDEVGPAGDVLWYLRRLEPPDVLSSPIFLQYRGMDYDRSILTPEMLSLELELDDELSPLDGKNQHLNDGRVRLIFPHWRSGTLPLSARIRHLFPTAYEAPRVRFMLVDGNTNQKFPGWVVRERHYIYGLENWYESRNVMPGSIIQIHKGLQSGEVIVLSENRRPTREWIRTVLVGSDGGMVFAMLKQIVSTPFDERMAIAIPDKDALDQVWIRNQKERIPFDRIVMNTVKELSKLNPQSHVHASELYAAVNVIRRSPPGPILTLLASHPWFVHVGDLHYRLSDSDDD